MKSQTEFPLIDFQSQNKWRQWLLKIIKIPAKFGSDYKKKIQDKSINHEEALCFGWNDGQIKRGRIYLDYIKPAVSMSLIFHSQFMWTCLRNSLYYLSSF